MTNDFKKLYEKNLKETKEKVKASVGDDQLIINAISTVDDVERIANHLSKRFREWAGLTLPELSHSIEEHTDFVTLVLTKNRKDLLKELGLNEEKTMGAVFKSKDMDALLLLGHLINSTNMQKEQQLAYIKEKMKVYCPNLLELVGENIGAKLLHHAGSLKRLALFPSSTVQLLGAEKALFRHLTTGAKPPRHGVIINHPFVAQLPQKLRGKMARMLADKISVCVRLDYFKGEFKAPEYKKELEEKFDDLRGTEKSKISGTPRKLGGTEK